MIWHRFLQHLWKSQGFAVPFFFCSSQRLWVTLSMALAAICSWQGEKKNNAPEEFLGWFWPRGQILKGKWFCACWTRKAKGCSSVKDDLQWDRVCPATVFWGNLAYFALLCWWSTFLTVGMFLLSNAELLGWIIHREISPGRNFQQSLGFFFSF